MRFQVQEMARAERMLTDEAIAHEVETYNELIPGPASCRARCSSSSPTTPRSVSGCRSCVGIEFARALRARRAWSGSRVQAVPSDEERLTRDDITSTVHYLKFRFDAEQRAELVSGAARLVVDHPEYQVWVELNDAQRAELAGDFAD